MQSDRFFIRFTTLSVMSCILAACQMSADNLAPTTPAYLQARPSAKTTGHETGAKTVAVSVPVKAASRVAEREHGVLSMEEAVKRSIGWHPAIDEASGRIHQSEERIRAAQAGYYPSINAGINSAYKNRDEQGWRPKLEVTASQLLYDFGKVSSSVDTELAGKKINQARMLLEVDNLARDTANAVIEVQRYRALVDLAQAQVEGVKKIAALVQERTDGGASTMSDQVQAAARVEAALSTQWQYQSEYDRWQVALAALTGGSTGSIRPAQDVPLWFANACTIQEPDWTKVPAMLEAEAQKEEAGARLEASKAQALPTVSLEASTGYDLNRGHSFTISDDKKHEYSVGINVSSNLYNGGQTSARKRAAGYALQTAESALRRARYDAQRNLLEARSQVDTLARLQSSLSARTDMMAKTRDLYRDQYVELGTRTLLDLLNAEQELHQAQFQIANVTHDIHRLSLMCTYNSGQIRQRFQIDVSGLAGRIGIL